MVSASLPSTFLLTIFLLSISSCIPASSSKSSRIAPTTIGNGYRLVSLQESSDGGLLGHLQVNRKNSIYGPDIPHLHLYIKHETDDRLRVHISDAQQQRWEVPYDLLPRDRPSTQAIGKSRENPITVSEFSGGELIFSCIADPFSFAVKRKSNGQTLFNSTADKSAPYNSLVFKDQYLEISTSLPSDASLYGLGENSQPHGIKLYPNDPYTLWTTDQSAINLNMDLYGSHPVYMDLRNVGGEAYAHGVLLLNSNGMDVFYRGSSLTYKVIGGVMDFYFFSGPSPLNVVDQYTQLIGRPAPMPYWSLGFHQCRWGYHNLSVVEDVVENYNKANIPLDVIWNDDDHMDGHKDFTLNPNAYPRPKLLDFLSRIHARGMKYIVIIDPGIGVNSSYGTYQRGLAKDVFIKYEGKPYLAQVWPGAVNFPDFLNPATVSWWGDEVRRFHELVPVDGLWIDMNEASNFCSGLCTIPKGKCPTGTGPGWICCLDCKNITKTRWDDPPYKINASGTHVPIGYKTIATSAVHYNGVREYDAHSMYGFSHAIATHKALQGLEGKRPFILSRSTFVGSGRYTAHWTGDNQGTWNDIKYSISTMLNFGIFGIPMVGSDICGFYPQPTEELCNRWIELGAFYPFSRDHANYYSPRQELYQWETVAKSARNALGMRYKLLPYLYTLTYEAHTTGAPIARPLFFSFPNIKELYGLSTQFLLGESLMVSPVLDQGQTNVSAMFPPGTWYSLFDPSQAIVAKQLQTVTLDAPLHVINVHLYQNTILPMQRGGMISKDARMTPFTLIVTFPAGATEAKANGKLYVDNDELPEMTLGNGQSTYVDFSATASKNMAKVWSDVEESKFALEKGWVIEKITVLGLSGIGGEFAIEVEGNSGILDVSKVELVETEHKFLDGLKKEGEGAEKKSVMVEVGGLRLPVGKKFTMSWRMGIS
ncbi:alpha-xylosidase 1-like [Cynara cardunculus var. scolymus]|uniref:Galactose mutarotase-like domain-containing protein n=1 Tax=Cynara cardunculus var. scolymus TaxID=59895 RepID=A0A118K332_CYNCS|nr:alpha-xylosidase 1-like [Cynara cardunculus var. scolymus]KVI05310.1 Galactose mutarotase-like domain-containing protein [Cynara cardunculus var. scolymus]